MIERKLESFIYKKTFVSMTPRDSGAMGLKFTDSYFLVNGGE